MSTIERPQPERLGEAEPFLEALAAGELRLQRCLSCARVAHPGTPQCRHCLGRDFSWEPASGRGTVYSWVTIARSFHQAFEAPYTVCVIELDEGPRLIAELAGDAEPQAGLPVAVDFSASGPAGVPLRFAPVV